VDTDILEEHAASIFRTRVWRFRNKLAYLASYKEGDYGTRGEGIKESDSRQ
jgi:hypothetical protein